MLKILKFTVWYLTVQMIVLYTNNYTVFYRIANLIEKAFEALIIHEYLIVWVQKNLLILVNFRI